MVLGDLVGALGDIEDSMVCVVFFLGGGGGLLVMAWSRDMRLWGFRSGM